VKAALALVGLFACACGARPLEFVLAVGADCRIAIPAGGSLQYEVAVGGNDGGAAARVCGACLPVTAPIGDSTTLIALLRASAPTCTVEHDTTLRVRITSFAGAGCTAAVAGVAADRVCALSSVLASSSGRGDQRLEVALSCGAGCDTSACLPSTCAAQGKSCGSLPNGCGETLDCGSCKSPQKCGGGGVDNVCGR